MNTKLTKETKAEKIYLPNLGRRDLLAELPKVSAGAELGVFEGVFSAEILQIVKPRMLYMVDLFNGVVSSGDKDGNNVRAVDTSKTRIALQDFYLGRCDVHVVKARSYLWLAGFFNALDWVYIDTDHLRGTTEAELEAARVAVVDGGIIAGHDYDERFPGVVQSVDEFVEKYSLELRIFGGDGLASYWIKNQ